MRQLFGTGKSSDRATRSRVPRWGGLWVLLAAMMIGGCTSIKLVYPRLDWYTQFKLGRYVELHESQAVQVRQDVDAFWAWHRAEELPRYAADLRAIAAVDPGTVDARMLAAWSDRIGGYGRMSLQRAMPGFCAFAKTLGEDQVRSIGTRMDEDLEKFEDDHLKRDEDDERHDQARRLAGQIERWTGALNDTQEQMLHAWRDAHPLLGPESLALRRQWRAAFLSILARHGAADQCAALETLFVAPRSLRDEATQMQFDAAETQLRETIARIIAASDARQREHARRELLKLADDLDALSRGA